MLTKHRMPLRSMTESATSVCLARSRTVAARRRVRRCDSTNETMPVAVDTHVHLFTPEHWQAVHWVKCGGIGGLKNVNLVVSEAEMATALRLFEEAVAEVAADPQRVAHEAEAAGALNEPEAGG